MKILFIFFLHLLVISCSKKELSYSKEQLFKMAKEGDPDLSFVLPKSINEGINCKDYSEGCVSGHTVKIKNLELIAVEFMTEDQAKLAALKVRGYYSRNWVFDDVTGEPTLESFVQKYLEAKKP
jgi:hypothetical protein